jgi:phage baseplate assembly protein V
MLRRAIMSLIIDDNPVQVVQLKLFQGECRQGMERMQEYGYTSVPLADGQALAVFVDGECAHGVVVATDDRRYRPRGKNPGDVTLYTFRNAEGDAHHIYLDATTRDLVLRAKTIRIVADENIEMSAGKDINLVAGGEITRKAEGDITDKGANVWLN